MVILLYSYTVPYFKLWYFRLLQGTRCCTVQGSKPLIKASVAHGGHEQTYGAGSPTCVAHSYICFKARHGAVRHDICNAGCFTVQYGMGVWHGAVRHDICVLVASVWHGAVRHDNCMLVASRYGMVRFKLHRRHFRAHGTVLKGNGTVLHGALYCSAAEAHREARADVRRRLARMSVVQNYTFCFITYACLLIYRAEQSAESGVPATATAQLPTQQYTKHDMKYR